MEKDKKEGKERIREKEKKEWEREREGEIIVEVLGLSVLGYSKFLWSKSAFQTLQTRERAGCDISENVAENGEKRELAREIGKSWWKINASIWHHFFWSSLFSLFTMLCVTTLLFSLKEKMIEKQFLESWEEKKRLESVYHCEDSGEGLLAHALDVLGGQDEAVLASVGQLDGVGVLDAGTTLSPVVTATWNKVHLTI